jgi:hypothetical protein
LNGVVKVSRGRAICRIAGGLIVIFIGLGVGVGSWALWDGAPASWSDVIADNSSIQATARLMSVTSFALLVGGALTIFNARWGPAFAAVFTLVFTGGAFWANHALFGSIRLTHTGVNVIVAGVVLLLLRLGIEKPRD